MFFYGDTVAAEVIELRQRKPISLADAIIAAAALTYLTLFTDNIKGYSGIDGLKFLSIADILGE
jgi:predicted nucleic acid-binding protein